MTQPSCNNPTGSIDIAETGGTPPYSYSWLPSVSTGPGAAGLAEGQYIITVTDSAKCTESITGSITAFVAPVCALPPTQMYPVKEVVTEQLPQLLLAD